jgi:long-subunit fatty acid transport protein
MSKDLKVGFGVYGNFGLGLDYDSDWVGRYYVQEGTLLGLSLQPTVAYRVNEKLSVAEPIPCAASRLRQVPTVATNSKLSRHFVVTPTRKTAKHNLRAFHQARLVGATSAQSFQFSHRLGRTAERHRNSRHAAPIAHGIEA